MYKYVFALIVDMISSYIAVNQVRVRKHTLICVHTFMYALMHTYIWICVWALQLPLAHSVNHSYNIDPI